MTQSQKDAFYDKLFAMIINELKEDEGFLKYVLNNHFGMTKKEVFEAYPNTKNLIVSDISPRSRLKQKVDANFAEYKEQWLRMSPAELIERCEELEAVTRMAKELPSAVSEEDAEYLLRFRNPLEVVSDEWIRRDPAATSVFGECVDAVVHAPFGAWPSQCYNYYDCDDAALKEYDKASKYQDKEDAEKQIAKEAAKAAKKGLPYTAPENPETFKDYLDKWIYGVKDNDELLDKIGGARLAKLKVVPGLGYAKR